MASLDHCDSRHGSGTLGETVSRREATVVDMMQNAETAAWVLAAINALPEPLRSTLDLVYRRGMKHREAAEELGIPVGTVKSRLNAAIHRLHDSWERARLSVAQAKLYVAPVRPR
jgi:RNA polymerase sigma-70 factor (ECF subfamily)